MPKQMILIRSQQAACYPSMKYLLRHENAYGIPLSCQRLEISMDALAQ